MPDRSLLKILFLAANPQATTRLQIDEEVRQIDRELRSTEYRDRFELYTHGSVTYDDLQALLLRYQPHVVHFSGHGSQIGEIILNSKDSDQPVSGAALSGLFAILKDNVRCVVLNACYSKLQAKAIAKQIDCVIGMSDQISDTASIRFSAAFYRALGYGRTIQEAFDLGCNVLELAKLNDKDVPHLFWRKGAPTHLSLLATLTSPSTITPSIADPVATSQDHPQASISDNQNFDAATPFDFLQSFLHSWWKRITIGATIGVLLTIIGLWADVLSIQSWLSPLPTVAPTTLSPTATLPIATPTPMPAAFNYGVSVYGADNKPIVNALVRIEVEGKAPLDEYTDSNGYARISVPAALAQRPGRVSIEADGYVVKSLNIDLWPDRLPDKAVLEQK